MCSRRSVSSVLRRTTGIPVHMLTTWAMSSSVTTGTSFDWSSCHFVRSSSIASLPCASSSRSRAAAS